MKNKGFTLVELIAIIALLGIIAVMTIPRIIKLAEKTRHDTIKTLASEYISTIEKTCMSNYEEVDDETYSITQNCNYNGDYEVIDGTLKQNEEEHKIEIKGQKPQGHLTIEDGNITSGCLEFEKYSVNIENNEPTTIIKGSCLETGTEYTYDYTGEVQTFTAPATGYYKIELWGASGGEYTVASYWGTNFPNSYGLGGYTSGEIKLKAGEKLYVYVGEQGKKGILGSTSLTENSYNGGGKGAGSRDNDDAGAGGGGATDVRFFTTTPTTEDLKWDSPKGLASRIMVAGAGAGANATTSTNGDIKAGHGGGLTGVGTLYRWQTSLVTDIQLHATQTDGYAFGKGGDAVLNNDGAGSGGGGGYYGGKTQTFTTSYSSAGGGGSSFISGYKGCVAINGEQNITPKCTEQEALNNINCSYHYSNKKFENSKMRAGNQVMPTTNGTSTETGHSGNGYAKITYTGKNLSEEKNNIDVYYSYGTSYHNIYTTNTWATTHSLPTASFLEDSIYLGTNDYYVAYTDTIDLSKYKTVIFKKTGFSTTDANVRKRAYFAKYIEKTNEAGESYIPTWVEIGTNIYAADISAQTRNDLKFGIDAYGGTNSGNIYYIAFSSDTIEEIKSNNELINSL